MKNYKQGFAIPLVIAIIALLGIGGGTYVYVNKKSAEKVENMGGVDWNKIESSKNKFSTTTNISTSTTKSILPVNVISPNGGEVLVEGNPYNISWSNTDSLDNRRVTIFLHRSDGVSSEIVSNLPSCHKVPSCVYNWKVTTSVEWFRMGLKNNLSTKLAKLFGIKIAQAADYSYKIAVAPSNGGNPYDYSDNFFTIIKNDVTKDVTNQPAYLISAYTKNGGNYIDVDYVEWLRGEAAIKAEIEDGNCPNIDNCQAYPNGYKRNQNPMIRTFEVSPAISIEASGLINGILNSYKTNVFSISFETFKSTVLTLKPVLPNKPTFKDPLDFITIDIKNGMVTKIVEQYQQ